MAGLNLTRAEARERSTHLSVIAYDVSLDLSGNDATFPSVSTIRFASSRPGTATFVDLVAPAVHRILLNGHELDPATAFDGYRIALPAVEAENELIVDAACAYMRTGEGMHRFVDPVDGERYLYSDYEPADARRVFACFDQPDLKAPFTFTVDAPSGWQVVSNSPTPEPMERRPGVSRWRFEPTPRLATYVTAIVAGPYHAVRGSVESADGRTIPLGVFCRASLARYLDADRILDLTRRGFGYFEPLFGAPYPFAKYDQLFVPEFNSGAMENAGAVTITEGWIFRSRVADAVVEYRAGALLHELAHMWFGDLVTMRWWDDLWLNESFATYAEYRAQAEATDWTSAWTTFAGSRNSRAYRADQLPSTHPVVADVVDLETAELAFDGITYEKGASVIRQLAAWVGRDAFDEGVRRYVARYAWANAELRDLLAELEATSGRDVGRWSKLWLETAGIATLRSVLETDADGRIASLAIRQEVPPDHPVVRPHRLSIGCYDLAGDAVTLTDRVEIDVDGEETRVPELVGRRRPDILLIDDDDHAYAKIRLDDASLGTALARLEAIADPVARGLVWSIAWDMTRDAELPAREFVRLVLDDIGGESDSSLIGGLLDGLTTSLRLYLADDGRLDLAAEAADRLLSLARAATPGGDPQLQLFRAFVRNATTDPQLDVVRAVLDGTDALDGLPVDTDLRWELLTALVAAGRADDAEIDAGLARDRTSAGERAAMVARSARPTLDAKREAWTAVVERDDLSNAMQNAAVAGFARVRDRGLLQPFVAPYFEALERVWTTRSERTAQRILVGLYPALLASEDILERTDRAIESVGAEHPGLRRVLLENRDIVRRALRARGLDARTSVRST